MSVNWRCLNQKRIGEKGWGLKLLERTFKITFSFKYNKAVPIDTKTVTWSTLPFVCSKIEEKRKDLNILKIGAKKPCPIKLTGVNLRERKP
jgi:hypothetical protein